MDAPPWNAVQDPSSLLHTTKRETPILFLKATKNRHHMVQHVRDGAKPSTKCQGAKDFERRGMKMPLYGRGKSVIANQKYKSMTDNNQPSMVFQIKAAST